MSVGSAEQRAGECGVSDAIVAAPAGGEYHGT